MSATPLAPGPQWRIGLIRHESTNGVERVVADVAGTPLWFESSDAPLAPTPEAFAGVLMLPALQQGATISTEARLDPKWLSGTSRLPPIYELWWKYPASYPIAHAGATETAEPQAPGAAACFTGGVDSFHTLLFGQHPVDHLVYVHGFDIGLADAARMAAFDPMFREVAAARGKHAVVVRTNLREHPIFNLVNWERTHGSALAAVGLVLGRSIGTFVIPSSYRYIFLRPWGSHPGTDPLWSTQRTSVVHDDALLGREEKLARIAQVSLVWSRLRVCWENRTPAGNCSRCHKCIRTMLGIAGYGHWRNFTVFDTSTPLAARVDSLPFVPDHLVQVWEKILGLDLEPDVRSALERLLARSGPGRSSMASRLNRYVRRLQGRRTA